MQQHHPDGQAVPARRPDAQDHCLDPDERVDLESEQSFPASDPPSWTLGPDRADGA